MNLLVLAGILGALIAINFEALGSEKCSLADLAKAAVAVHAESARMLAEGGPIAALDLALNVGKAIVEIRSEPQN
jgi:NAD(P)H-hydrate repair Nnr-like enzyme with NAD(P)H-hydrate dehydratase domain